MENYLIVGAGLAGVALAHFFEANNIEFSITDPIDFSAIKRNTSNQNYLDKAHPFQSASYLSTGIVNPVTGRRFVKSWKIDEFLPFAKSFYTQMENKLQCKLIRPMPILRFFQDKSSENEFAARIHDAHYQPFFTTTKYNAKGYSINENSVLFTKSFKVDVYEFIHQSLVYFKQKNKFFNEAIDCGKIERSEKHVKVANLPFNFTKIIFCEGYKAQYNPFFEFIPFTSQRGQLLEIECDQIDAEVSLKKRIQVTPYQKNTFTLSTTWDWNELNPIPTNEGKEKLVNAFEKICQQKYKVIDHKAAIRPTVKDRRPVIGYAKNEDKFFIFNGLGSKGTSLAPFFSNEITKHFSENKSIMKEVNVKRFYA